MTDASTVTLRAATIEDDRLLFDWVNAPDSLANKATTQSPIEWPTHREWLERRIADPRCLVEIIEVDGKPVGQVRLEPGDHGHFVDIYVSPAFRRAHLAFEALTDALERCTARPVVALVKSGNTASLALFRSLRFHETGSENGLVQLKRED